MAYSDICVYTIVWCKSSGKSYTAITCIDALCARTRIFLGDTIFMRFSAHIVMHVDVGCFNTYYYTVLMKIESELRHKKY